MPNNPVGAQIYARDLMVGDLLIFQDTPCEVKKINWGLYGGDKQIVIDYNDDLVTQEFRANQLVMII